MNNLEIYLGIAGYGFLVYLVIHLRLKNEIRFWYWLITAEKKHRNDKSENGYPQDWQFRRLAIYRRDKGKCSICGRNIGRLRLWFRSIEKSGLSNNAEVHIHHGIPISKGGSHDLNNLKALCMWCHAQRHPGNSSIIKGRSLTAYGTRHQTRN